MGKGQCKDEYFPQTSIINNTIAKCFEENKNRIYYKFKKMEKCSTLFHFLVNTKNM